MARFIPYRRPLTSRARLLRRNGTPAERKLWLDGESHFVPDGQRYDAARTTALASLGIRVLRFTNLEVTGSFESVCMRIVQALQT